MSLVQGGRSTVWTTTSGGTGGIPSVRSECVNLPITAHLFREVNPELVEATIRKLITLMLRKKGTKMDLDFYVMLQLNM